MSASISRRRRYRAWPSSGPACGGPAGPDMARTTTSAVYPAFCTAAISVSAGAVTAAVPVAKLTAAMTSGPKASSFFSARVAHAAQVMPPRVQASLTYNPLLVAASVVIAVIAGTAALWAALRLDTLFATIAASLIMGVAVSGMHYTGMAALRVYPAPGVTVDTAATASALAFLLPLILGLSMVGFIFSTVIALSPTAAEILEEGELMAGIAHTAQHGPQAGLTRAPARPAPADPDAAQPGDLFRPQRQS